MKKRVLMLFAAAVAGASVATTASAKDPCQTLVCMAGMAMSGGTAGGCSSAVGDFFSIVKFHHGFSASRTSNARRDFLNQCQGAQQNQGQVDAVISQFGRIRR